MSLVVLPFLVLSSLVMAPCSGVLVETRWGRLKGATRTSRSNETYYTFTSIPYARPPIGPLRLKNPVRGDGWDGILDASGEDCPVCPQIAFAGPNRGKVVGVEDCLYLHVATRSVDKKSKLPVMIYIHGGGFFFGQTHPITTTSYLMDQEVVVVTLTYRLGPLGFLSTEDEVIPGNFGLKDQALAIGWVKESIEDFGGDPDSIFVFGESAGGASTHYQMISPLNQGKLKGGISESGTTLAPWALASPGDSLKKTKVTADHLGCPSDDHRDLLRCLREASLKDITMTHRLFTVGTYDVGVKFLPVIEKPGTPGAFITSHPSSYNNDLPWITGVTSSEGSFILAFLLSIPEEERKNFKEKYEQILPNMFYYSHLDNPKRVTNELKKLYFKDKPVLNASKEAFEDCFFICPMYRAARNHKGPLYQYYFDHNGEKSLIEQLAPNVGDLGVTHVQEYLYLMDLSDVNQLKFDKMNEADLKISKNLVQAWTNFAKYSKPSTEESDFVWEMSEGKKFLHMKTEQFVMSNLDLDEKCSFWDNVASYKNLQKTEL